MEKIISEIRLTRNQQNDEPSQIISTKIRFTKHYCNKILHVFDIECKKENEFPLPLNDNFRNYGTKCLLPNGDLFYCDESHAVIIDSSNNIKLIQNHKRFKIWAGSFYFNGYIYLIGQPLKYSERYCIKENRWTPIANPFKESTKSMVCALYEGLAIFGSPSASSVIIYDINLDSYSELQIEIQDDGYVGFLSSNKSLFMIHFSKYIYESDGNLSKWENVGNCLSSCMNCPMSTSPIIYKEKIYFLNLVGIFEFNLKKKKIRKFKKALF